MIYDCFSYWDEDLLLDLRFNILNKDVDFFVVVEGNKTWRLCRTADFSAVAADVDQHRVAQMPHAVLGAIVRTAGATTATTAGHGAVGAPPACWLRLPG